MPKPETLAWLRHTASCGQASSQLMLEVLERLKRLEAMGAHQLPRLEKRLEVLESASADPELIDEPQTMHTIALGMVDNLEQLNVLPEILDTLRRAIREPMEAATCPHIRNSDEGTSYCALAEQVAQQQPRTVKESQPPAGLSMLDELAQAIGNPAVGNRWRSEARRVAAVIVRRMRGDGSLDVRIAADWLEREAAK